MAESEKCEMLAYFIGMAQAEAVDLVRSEQAFNPLRGGTDGHS